MSDLSGATARGLAGGPERHREKAREQGKLPVRERIALLLDDGSFSEEGLLANWLQDGLGADGVVTGVGTIDGRAVALMANDPTVKAGSWGPKTVEKILRIQERALSLQIPIVYLVDSAGARITLARISGSIAGRSPLRDSNTVRSGLESRAASRAAATAAIWKRMASSPSFSAVILAPVCSIAARASIS